jgi:DsbC/DsbD-like thiol-disulfide interchange protein
MCEAGTIQGGRSFWLALVLKMQPDWHCYWLNPGHTGFTPRLKWSVPESFHVGETAWPQPRRFMASGQIGFGYEHEVAWLVEITPPSLLSAGAQIRVSVGVEWLLCRDVCLRSGASHELILPVSPPVAEPCLPYRDIFERFRLSLPQSRDEVEAVFYAEGEFWVLRLHIPADTTFNLPEVYFYPCQAGWIDPVAYQSATVQGTTIEVQMLLCDTDCSAPDELKGVLVWREGNGGSDSIAARRVDTARKSIGKWRS